MDGGAAALFLGRVEGCRCWPAGRAGARATGRPVQRASLGLGIVEICRAGLALDFGVGRESRGASASDSDSDSDAGAGRAGTPGTPGTLAVGFWSGDWWIAASGTTLHPCWSERELLRSIFFGGAQGYAFQKRVFSSCSFGGVLTVWFDFLSSRNALVLLAARFISITTGRDLNKAQDGPEIGASLIPFFPSSFVRLVLVFPEWGWHRAKCQHSISISTSTSTSASTPAQSTGRCALIPAVSRGALLLELDRSGHSSLDKAAPSQTHLY